MQNLLDIEEVKKPWGYYRRFTLNKPSSVKFFEVLPGQQLSMQYHNNRDEFWKILPGGDGEATIGQDRLPAKPLDEFYIPRNTVHRLKANDKSLFFMEIAFGVFDEEDIVRLEDSYGRI